MSRNNISLFDHRIFSGFTLAPTAFSTTEEIFQLGKTENQALDWDVTSTAAISMKVEILQSNAQLGPFVKWSNPSAAGSTVVNQITTAVAQDGSDLQLIPSGFAKVKVTNLGTANLVINRMDFFIQ